MEKHWLSVDALVAADHGHRRSLAGFGIGAVLIVTATVAAHAVPREAPGALVFLLLAPAPILAAVFGGAVPGLTAGLVAAVAGVALASRREPLAASLEEAALFALLGATAALGAERLRRSGELARHRLESLHEREAHLQSILDTVPDAMIVIDEAGCVQSFSRAAERLFGWSRAEVVGQNVKMLMPAPDRASHDAHLDRYRRTGEQRIIGKGRVVLCERRGGDTFPAELSVGEVLSSGHRFFTGFLRDLTERQESESRLDRMQSELIHISRLSAMGEMAAALAHELNQPLSAIANYLRGGQRLLEGENPASRAIDPMGRAADQALRAGQIIRRLRDFVARGESERRVESLHRLLEEASGLALVGARSQGVTVRVERDPAIDQVFVDKVQIQQVLVNLVRNALEAMEDTSRRELTVSVVAGPDDMAEVRVVDTGDGISPSVADRLFQPFVSTKSGQGMGVGLSICRSIIEAHGGRIWAEPNPLGGAVFAFTIPRASPGEAV